MMQNISTTVTVFPLPFINNEHILSKPGTKAHVITYYRFTTRLNATLGLFIVTTVYNTERGTCVRARVITITPRSKTSVYTSDQIIISCVSLWVFRINFDSFG